MIERAEGSGRELLGTVLANSINGEEYNGIFVNANIGVLRGRLVSLEGIIRAFFC